MEDCFIQLKGAEHDQKTLTFVRERIKRLKEELREVSSSIDYEEEDEREDARMRLKEELVLFNAQSKNLVAFQESSDAKK
jgi:hypothetical protein